MELNHFARIGKGILSKAIGLQKNYKEVYTKGPDVLNQCKSNCYTCSIHAQKETCQLVGSKEELKQLQNQCKACPHAVWEPSYTVRYVNEKNRYGYQPTLKQNAIKLLLLYHFLQPDKQGFIKNISIKELAATLGCTKATIGACNQVLQTYNYCYTSDSGLFDQYINIYLPEYKNYHKTAAEGGRGYLTMSSDMLRDLCQIKAINTLRLNLKGILEVDNASYSDLQNKSFSVVTSPYQKLRDFLPDYCKKNVIQKALKADKTIFDIVLEEKTVTFKIKEKYAQKNMRDLMLKETKENLIEYVDQINTVLERAALANHPDEQEQVRAILSMWHIEPSEKYPLLLLRLTDYEDLASLALQYNIQMVHRAICCIYNHYSRKNRPIDRFGALARVMIQKKSFYEIAS